MSIQIKASSILSLIVLLYCSVLAVPPSPPAGKQWELVDNLSDEFDGTSLDTSKWTDWSDDGWIGRVPTRFEPHAISVAGGDLRITAAKKASPEGQWTHEGGLVRGLHPVTYGYFETRMKANKTYASSTFWLINKYGDGSGCDRRTTELDIQESVGISTGGHSWIDNFITSMSSSCSSRNNSCGEPEGNPGQHISIGEEVWRDYHIFAAWWKSATEVLIYLDDQYQYTINPVTNFDLPQYLRMVVEKYDWNPPLDGSDGMTDTWENRTTYYDYVRSYRLVDAIASPVIITQSGFSTDVAEEGETTDTYTIVLESQPTDTVTITVDPDIDTQVNSAGAGNAVQLTFLTSDWDTPQTVTVKAIDDLDIEGTHSSTIIHSSSSTDSTYNGINISSVIVNITDNDSSPNLLVDPGFETGVIGNWSGGAWGTHAVNTTEQRSGDYCWSVSGGGIGQRIPLEPFTEYTYTGWVKVAPGSSQVRIGQKDYGVTESAVGTTSTGYVQLTHTFTTGADASGGLVYLWIPAGNTGYGDDFELTGGMWDCSAVIAAGQGMAADLSGPADVSDCYVDSYDLVKLAELWLTTTDMDDLAVLSSQWMLCNDPQNGSCAY